MFVYSHLKPNGEVFYIGIGKTEKRAYSIRNRNKHWHNIVNKYGYSVEIVTTCKSWEEACEIEKYLIKFYGRKDLGLGTLVNMTDGGEGVVNKVVSKETREKLSLAQIGKKHSEETKKRMSETHKGQKPTVTRLVLDTETGVFYNSIKEASFYYDMSMQILWNMLNGRTINKTNLIKI